jgi:very-short-patch-repair endonuclease
VEGDTQPPLCQLKFRRQHPFAEYILDFYCSNTRLLLEIDGETHLGNEKADERRSAWLQQQGVKVLRFWNTQICDELESVLEMIFRECDARKDLRFQSSQVDQNDK